MGANSWFTAVKKALKSPIKGSERKCEQEENQKKRDKGRWIFSKASPLNKPTEQREAENIASPFNATATRRKSIDQRRSGFRLPLFEEETSYSHIASPFNATTRKSIDQGGLGFRSPVLQEETSYSRIPSPYNNARRKSTDQGNLGFRSPMFQEETADTQQRRSFAVGMATSAAEMVVAKAQTALEIIRLGTPSNRVIQHYAAVAIQTAFRGYLARKALQALKGVVKMQAFVRGYIVRKRTKMTLQCMQSLLRVQNQICHQRKRLSTDSKFSPLKPFYQVAEMKSNSRASTSSISADEVHPHKYKEAITRCQHWLPYAFPHQDEKLNPRERIKAAEMDTPLSYSPTLPQNQGQNLLINSIASPYRSRTRTSKARSRVRVEEKTDRLTGAPINYSPAQSYVGEAARSRSAPRQRERERGKRLSFAGSDLYTGV